MGSQRIGHNYVTNTHTYTHTHTHTHTHPLIKVQRLFCGWKGEVV